MADGATGTTLAEVFLAARTPANVRTTADLSELETSLQELTSRAAAAWPTLTVPGDELVRHLAGLIPAEDGEVVSAIRSLHAGDLYLALACTRGQPEAIALFYQQQRSTVDRILARMRLQPAAAADVCHVLMEKVLFAVPPHPPRIASYAGQAPLSAWMAVAARRAALDVLQPGPRAQPADELEDQWLSRAEPPELAAVKARHRGDVSAALRAGLSRLSRRHRTLLRLNVVEELSQDAIGRLYRVNRSTVCRWLAEARDELLGHVSAFLGERHIRPEELASLVLLVSSQVDVSAAALDRSADVSVS
jgi:RNA polymerase sigma-70 factor (ECF subfamily)